ncbi:MAG TPA: hypothetical protein VF677_11245 [Flavobacterium sp.]|jgi:hypothetical protein
MPLNKYKGFNDRILVDIDNERPYGRDIVGLSKTDEVINFNGDTVTLEEGKYIYTYTESIEKGVLSYIFAEGYVIRSPYKDLATNGVVEYKGK